MYKHNIGAFIGSLIIITFLAVVNLSYSSHPWFLYAAYPVMLWPVSAYFGKRAKTLPFAIMCSIGTILYYTILNVAISPQTIWAIYPVFATLWWPLSLYFYQCKKNEYLASTNDKINEKLRENHAN